MVLKLNCPIIELKKHIDMIGVDAFYGNCLLAWYGASDIVKKSIVNPCSQIIWWNDKIRYKGNILYFKEWVKNGIVYIRDLYNDNGIMKSYSEIVRILDIKQMALMQYFKLINAIPKQWLGIDRKTIDEYLPDVQVEPSLYCHDQLKCITLSKLSSKFVRNKLINKIFEAPTAELYWQRKCNEDNLNWKQIWGNLSILTLKFSLPTGK